MIRTLGPGKARTGRGRSVDTLPNHLRPGLRLLVCGMNPGRYAAWYGMYFARPGNLFWSALRGGITFSPKPNTGSVS